MTRCCRQSAGKQPQTFEATDYLIIDLQRSAWLQNHAKEKSEIYYIKGDS